MQVPDIAKRKSLVIKFDGACNNGLLHAPMGVGVASYVEGELVTEVYLYAGIGSSNVAEWKGLRKALTQALKELYDNPLNRYTIIILGDSQLIIRQFTDIYKIKQEEFTALYEECKQIETELKRICDTFGHVYRGVDWIPRTENGKADELSKQGRRELYE